MLLVHSHELINSLRGMGMNITARFLRRRFGVLMIIMILILALIIMITIHDNTATTTTTTTKYNDNNNNGHNDKNGSGRFGTLLRSAVRRTNSRDFYVEYSRVE